MQQQGQEQEETRRQGREGGRRGRWWRAELGRGRWRGLRGPHPLLQVHREKQLRRQGLE